MNATVVWDNTRCVVVNLSILATTSKIVVNPFHKPMRWICGSELAENALTWQCIKCIRKVKKHGFEGFAGFEMCVYCMC